MKEQDDRELMKAIAAGNSIAFKDLVSRYSERLYRFIWYLVFDRDLAEDIVQEVFTKIWSEPKKYDPEKSTKFSAWIFTVARNQAFDELQKRKRLVHLESDDSEIPKIKEAQEKEKQELSGEERLAQKQNQKLLIDALNKLDAESLAVTELYYFEDFGYREIAKISGLSERRVEYKLTLARKELKDYLSSHHDELMR